MSNASEGGCYGFRLAGVDGARSLLVEAPAGWPRLTVTRAGIDGATPPAGDVVGPRTVELPFQNGGWMRIERATAEVRFHLDPQPSDAELVHPFLAPGAAVLARWAGRESFHAGAVAGRDGAWAVLGDKESGKSSTLAWLALAGHTVLADDLVVLADGTAFAGPRCVDLRGEAATRLGVGEPLGMVGARERWRLSLGSVPARMPLCGWVLLEWGDDVAVERVRGPDRMIELIRYRSVRLEPQVPAELMALASLPVLKLRRPQRWDSMAEAGQRLVAAIGG